MFRMRIMIGSDVWDSEQSAARGEIGGDSVMLAIIGMITILR